MRLHTSMCLKKRDWKMYTSDNNQLCTLNFRQCIHAKREFILILFINNMKKRTGATCQKLYLCDSFQYSSIYFALWMLKGIMGRILVCSWRSDRNKAQKLQKLCHKFPGTLLANPIRIMETIIFMSFRTKWPFNIQYSRI